MRIKLLIVCMFTLTMGFYAPLQSQEDDGDMEDMSDDSSYEYVEEDTSYEYVEEDASAEEMTDDDSTQVEVIEYTEEYEVIETVPTEEFRSVEVVQPVIIQPAKTQQVQSRPVRSQPVKTAPAPVKPVAAPVKPVVAPVKPVAAPVKPVAVPAASDFASLDASRVSYINKINSFRSTLGLPALQRWTDGEACADNSAKTDATSGVAHKSMGSCGEFAQNTCPNYDSIASGNSTCLQMMWNEGPPPSEPCTGACFAAHGHYINMTNKSYTKVAVGFHQLPNGKVWINMNFK